MNPTQNAWHHIRRSPIQSFVAVLVMTISFLSLNTFVIISNGMSDVLKYFETKPEITIFLKDGLDKTTVENLQQELAGYPGIREIKFISKDKALSLYKEQNKNNPMLTEMVTASILPASFEVSVSNPSVLEQISQNFSAKKAQIDEIIYQKDIIKSLLNWTDIIRKVGIITVSLSTGITFLIISVIIGMKITNRKEEISISRLLGASNFYVKKPFLIEGIFYGVTGSLVGALSAFGISQLFAKSINHFFSPITFISTDIIFYGYLLGLSLVLGSIIGFLASWLGSKRYIKF